MKTDNINTMNVQNEIIAASISAFPNTADMPSIHRRYGFKVGANWQMQKDKDIINILCEVLRQLDNASICFADDHKHYYDKGNEAKINEMLANLHNSHLKAKQLLKEIEADNS